MQVIKSEQLSTPSDTRYICIDEQTGKILDDAQGFGYKTKQKAHVGFIYKSKSREERKKDKENRKAVAKFLRECGKQGEIETEIIEIRFRGEKEKAKKKEITDALHSYLDTIGFDFVGTGVDKNFFLKYLDGK